jgi:predicted MFS family arabinose efflux permease
MFGSLCAMVFLVNLARIVFAPLVVPLEQEFGVTASTLGLITGLTWFGSAIPRFPVGYLLTKVSRKTVVLLSGGVLVTASLFTAFAPSFSVDVLGRTLTLTPVGSLMIGAFFLGTASGCYFLSANPLLSELFPERVGRVMGVHGAASQFAAVGAAPMVVAVLAVGDWRTTFYLLAAVSAVATLGTYLVGRSTETSTGTTDRDLLGAARTQWRLVVSGIAFVAFTGLVWNGVFNFYVKYMIEAKALSDPAANTLLTVLFAAGIPAFVVGGDLVERLPKVPFLIGISTVFAVSLLALSTVSGFLAIAALSVVVGFVIHMLFPAADTYMLSSTPDHQRASTYAVFSGTMMLPQAFGSVVFGAVLDAGVAWDPLVAGSATAVLAVMGVLFALYQAGLLPDQAVGSERPPATPPRAETACNDD